MTPENFVYWLQGYLELANPSLLDEKTILMIKEHLDLVHNGPTKSAPSNFSEEEVLEKIKKSNFSEEEFLEKIRKATSIMNPELICVPSDLSDTIVYC